MTKPNIIYILADDMGYGDVSRYNEKCPFQTPNFDKLCDEGIHFTDAHTTSAVCTPSRYGILTGRYNWRSKLKYEVLGGFSEPLIEEETKTIGSMLKDVGYKTACIGKWHLGMSFSKTSDFEETSGYADCDGINYEEKIENSPNTRGFDYYYGIAASLDMPPYVYIENDRFTEIPTKITSGDTMKGFFRPGKTGENFCHEKVLDELTDKVLDKISEYKNDPFFIYFPLPAPHTPILPADKFKGKSNTTAYGDFVLHCDDVLGRVVEKCEREGIADDTIIVFTSDNGCSPFADIPELNSFGHFPNYHFRGHKAEIYEGGHRVPYIIRWKNGIKAGLKTDKTVCLADFFKTIADILEYKIEDNVAVDSFTNLPLFNGEDIDVRTSVVHQSYDGSLSLRKGKWKLEMCSGPGGWEIKTKIEGSPEFQLYNLENDIGEEFNVIDSNQDIFESLKEELILAVLNGRTTIGKKLANHGVEIWETVSFLKEN